MKSFPSADTIEVPAGADGWEGIYPYYLTFREGDGSEDKFWFCDSQHWPAVLKPFETIGVEFAVKCLGQYNTRHLVIPVAKGIEFKVHLGYLYMSPIGVPEDEVAERVPEFERRVGHYFQNWPALLEQWYTKVKGTIAEMETLSFEPLPDMVPWEDIESGKAKDGSEILMENYDRLIQLAYQNWQYHFEFLNLGYLAYLDFFTFAKEVFPDIPDQAIAQMVQGVDMELFKPDDELKNLSVLAVQLGLADVFDDPDDVEGTLARIAERPSGAEWLEAWEEAQDPWFNFTVGNGFYGTDKYWNTHLDIPLAYIRDYVRRVEEGHDIMRPTEQLIEERNRIISEYRSMLDEEAVAAFDAKRELAAMAYPYVENHNFYIEHWTMGVFWRKLRELSRVFVLAGFWAEVDDILYLGRNEVRDALFDYATGWGVGSDYVGPRYWPTEIARRARIVEALQQGRPQPALNTPPEQITEPFTQMLWGITTEQVNTWLADDDEDDTGLKGMAASPGVVEGIARVVYHADDLSEVQDGDILVATITAPSWGPVFGKIKAAVTDIGGMMSHAAIVCREYALPAVTGTGNGSTTITTGQRVRVDGNRGIVEILEESADV